MRYFISVIMGLLVGSFSNVCIVRLPKDESICFPRSHCPRCGCPIPVLDNMPLVSFLALRGRCRSCQAPISWQYPFVEALMAMIFVFHAWFFSGSFASLVIADGLGFYLICISFIDYGNRIIPDELSLSLLGMSLLISFINPFLSGLPSLKFLISLGSSLAGGTFMLLLAYAGEKVFKKEALGGGDVKLIAATGALLGWRGIAGPLLLGSFSGGLIALILLLSKKKKLGETLPFGPFLSLGAYAACLYPDFWTALVHP